ncbi:FK506-binding protein 3-like, partial [Olea europaea var. sylvestris]|uniref:FK506-binding protein 3-like n=1 Tax=Olea europaea var. sylvestris TaxID=158386 RepID=UPI000C1D1CC0
KPHDVELHLRSEHELHDAEPQQQAQQELHAAEQEAQAAEHDVEAEAQAAEHELHDAEPEVQAAETDVEFGKGPKLDDEYEEGILGEEFTDSEYEQEENITVEDNDENTYFRLSESFDIGASGEQEGVRDVQEGEAATGEESGTEYEDSGELRSLPSDTEAEGSSARRKNVCWFNPATDMEDPQFKL